MTTAEENWKWVPGYRDLYEVSSLGHVRSHNPNYRNPRILKKSARGTVVLYAADGCRYQHVVRQLVQSVFGGVSAVISRKGSNNGQAKLTEASVREIKALLAARDKTQNQIAEVYGVTRQAVCLINSGKRWSHVT